MNFDFVRGVPGFSQLFGACDAAEQLAMPFPAQSCASSRSALEYIVALIYRSVADYDDAGKTLFEKMDDHRFIDYINDETIVSAMHTVRKNGNLGAHGERLSPQIACDTLEQLHYIVGEVLINLNLIDDYPTFESPLEKARARRQAPGNPAATPQTQTPTAVRAASSAMPEPAPCAPKQSQQPCEPSDDVVAQYAETLRQAHFSTRKRGDEQKNAKLYVQASLCEAGWAIASCDNQAYPETAAINMTLEDGSTIDYVLYGRDNRPLAVIDYTHALANPIVGRKHALNAATLMQKKYGFRPVAYYASGYHIFCTDALGFPTRRVFGFHSIDELELLKQRVSARKDISNPSIEDSITNRDYQKDAIRSICDVFQNQGRRRGVIVMATGTGKTRVSISLVKVLMEANWVKNVLFLADRTSLVRQAHKNFNKLLPNVTTSMFTGTSINRDKDARIIFATYQTMIGLIDGDTREFGIGRFDLIIVDEAHRSIFGKYPLLFSYFDSLMIGLTATPRCDDSKSTYQVFQAVNGEPDYAYELEQAINDGYLVGFHVLDKTTEGLRRGISYDSLTDEQKEEVEKAYANADAPNSAFDNAESLAHAVITPDTSNINRGTIRAMLDDLMQNSLKIDAGDKVGKTIIFAKNHVEAEVVVEEFHKQYDYLGNEFCKLIDSQVEDALNIIDNFGERDKLPQIAVSVDMLDTGVDIPDAVNLVFFKKVNSKIKFLQMVGRGTRLSPDLFGPGKDKVGFLAFDWYDNFRYFNATNTWSTVQGSGKGGAPTLGLGVHINQKKLQILLQLQNKTDKTDFEKRYEKELHNFFTSAIANLNNDAMAVNRNIAFVNKYRQEGRLDNLTKTEVEELSNIVVPLLPTEPGKPKVKSFDSLILTVESEYLTRVEEGKDPATIRNGFASVKTLFTKRMEQLQKLKTIPEVLKREKLIAAMMDGAYLLDDFSFERAEYVRKELRDLMKYIPDERNYYIIDLPDSLIDEGEQSGMQRSKSYIEKANEYLQDDGNVMLAKLRSLEPLTDEEKEQLKQVFTATIGSGADFAAWSGFAWGEHAEALRFLRKQVGIADETIEQKLGHALNDPELNEQQKTYLQQIVAYAQANGDITPKTLLNESPFNSIGVVELFGAEKFLIVKETLNTLHKPLSE